MCIRDRYFLDKGKINFKKSFLPNLKKSVIEAEGLGFITEIAKVFQKLVIYIVLGVKVIFNGMAIGDFSLYLSLIHIFPSLIMSAHLWSEKPELGHAQLSTSILSHAYKGFNIRIATRLRI